MTDPDRMYRIVRVYFPYLTDDQKLRLADDLIEDVSPATTREPRRKSGGAARPVSFAPFRQAWRRVGGLLRKTHVDDWIGGAALAVFFCVLWWGLPA